jgi:hypothetical protein
VQVTLMPKLARASTGNGRPYFVPGCAFSTMGTNVTRLPTKTVSIPCVCFGGRWGESMHKQWSGGGGGGGMPRGWGGGGGA